VTTTREPARDLAAELRERINSGRLTPGARLPPARELATSFDVALATAVRAVGVLREEGLVTTTRGRGSYVAVRWEIERWDASRYRFHPEGLSANRDEAEAGGYLDEITRTERSTTEATPELADRLGVAVGAALSVVRFSSQRGACPPSLRPSGSRSTSPPEPRLNYHHPASVGNQAQSSGSGVLDGRRLRPRRSTGRVCLFVGRLSYLNYPPAYPS